VFTAEAVKAAPRSCRSLYCRTRFAELTAIRAISGIATTINPLTRTDRSSHHRFTGPE
jgi:hypothetical protein